jgi:hypothetical protein
VEHDKVHFINGSPNDRIQCLISIDVDQNAGINGGNLWVVPYFHHFAPLASLFLTKVKRKKPETNLNKNFMMLKNDFLTEFQRFLDLYAIALFTDVITKSSTKSSLDQVMRKCIVESIEKEGSKWPTSFDKLPAPKFRWYYVNAPPGSAVFWSVGLPHCNGKNDSLTNTPRIACYVDYQYQLLDDVYNTKQFQDRKKDLLVARSRGNEDEHNKVWEKDWRTTPYTPDATYRFLSLDKVTPLMKALFGFDWTTGETYTWQQFEQEKNRVDDLMQSKRKQDEEQMEEAQQEHKKQKVLYAQQ